MTSRPLGLAALATAFFCGPIAAQPVDTLSKAHVNGVVLHYLDRGRGEPIVFVHGGLTDYREWGPVA